MLSGVYRRLPWLTVLVAASSLAGAQATLWSKRLEYQGDNEVSNSLCIDPSGNVYVVGSTVKSNVSDVLAAKYSAQGARLWTRRFGGSTSSEDVVDAKLDPVGNLYIAATQHPSGSSPNFLLLKYDPDGDLLWSRSFGGGSEVSIESLVALAVDSVGNAVVTGDGNNRTVLVKYRADGIRLWTRWSHGALGQDTNTLEVDLSDNHVVSFTRAINGGQRQIGVAKFSANGAFLWERLYDSPEDFYDAATDIAVDSQGNILVCGNLTAKDWYLDAVVLKYSPTGTLLWSRVLVASNGRSTHDAKVAVDMNDSILVGAHWYNSATNGDYVVAKISSGGTTLWRRYYDGPDHQSDWLNDIVVDADGSVYATGRSAKTSDPNGDLDFATVKWSSSGERRWVRRYGGSSDLADIALRAAISPDGNVVVTGGSRLASIDLAPDWDFYTIKYEAGP